MPRIQEYNTKTGPVLNITIPRKLAEFLDWQKGDKLKFIQKEGGVFLEKDE